MLIYPPHLYFHFFIEKNRMTGLNIGVGIYQDKIKQIRTICLCTNYLSNNHFCQGVLPPHPLFHCFNIVPLKYSEIYKISL